MKFYKYHAAGNDFVIIDDPAYPVSLSQKLCHRHFGIGADGVLFYVPSEKADARMRVFNADNSEAEMCGNGLRCFAQFMSDTKKTRKTSILVETGKGVLECSFDTDSVEVELGVPSFIKDSAGVPVIQRKLNDHGLSACAVDIGNPHLVIYNTNETPLSEAQAREIALAYRSPEFLGYEVNVEVIRSMDHQNRSSQIIVHERGAGFTLACGTGGGASSFALRENKLINSDIWNMDFPGGRLIYRITGENKVYLKGKAEKTFSGEFNAQQ